jgi:hypothetical protein
LLQESAQVWSEIFVNAATGAGIIAAGIWAYMRFVRQRDKYQKAEIDHRVEFLPLSEDRLLLRVGLSVRNTGSVLLTWKEGGIRVQQVAPCEPHITQWIESGLRETDATEGNWPVVGERSVSSHQQEIEPNEADATYFDFVLPSDVQTVLVYSFIMNSMKSDIAWNHTTTHRVLCYEGESQMSKPEKHQGRPKVAPKPAPSVAPVPQPTSTPAPTRQGPKKQPPPSPPPKSDG